MRCAVYLFGLIGFCLTITCQATAIEDDPNPWRVAPPVIKEVTSADRAARDELLKLIEKKQDPKYRAEWKLDIPERASGVPTNYDLLLYKTYGGWTDSASRIEIQVRGDLANIDLCDGDGLFGAKIPAREIDRLVRQLAYGFHAEEDLRTEDIGGAFGAGFASHVPYQTVEIISRDPQSPCHLITPAWQAIADDIGTYTNRIRGYVHTRTAVDVHKIAREHGKLLPEGDEMREIRARLRRVPLVNTDKENYQRKDLAAVEGTLYAHLAIQRKLADALADLQRLGLKEQAKHLEITTAANPQPLITEAVLAFRADSHLAYWAIDFAKDKEHPERLQWLIDVLPKDISPYNAEEILDHLVYRKLAQSQLEQIGRLYDQVEKPIIKVSAANLLLKVTDEPRYFDYLEGVIRTFPEGDKGDYLDPRRKAITCLFNYSVNSGKQRERAYAVLKTLMADLEPSWSEMAHRAALLGSLGSPADLPLLRKIAEGDSPHDAGLAIDAMALIEPLAALEVVHQRTAKFIRAPGDELNYRNEIYSRYDLLVAERDAAAVPLLKQAWERHIAAYPADADNVEYAPARAIAFLDAKTPSARADAALLFCRNDYVPEARLKRIASELRAEGADAEKCELILRVYERPPRGR